MINTTNRVIQGYLYENECNADSTRITEAQTAKNKRKKKMMLVVIIAVVKMRI